MDEIFAALDLPGRYRTRSEGDLPSCYAVTDLATASWAAAGEAAAGLVEVLGLGPRPEVTVDRRLASLWFSKTVRPLGWELPPVWDVVAGDYRTADGWIRLHTNRPHHRAAALRVLAVPADRTLVASAVQTWQADDLEAAIVGEGGAAAAMRSASDWTAHPQGRAVAAEPLVHWLDGPAPPDWEPTLARPLRGLRVLDLTRILAGPVATRFLAGLGATVLRIDPPDWDEPDAEAEVTLGKHCARLDLRSEDGRATFEALLSSAHLLVHGYRPGALEGLGLGSARRRDLAPRMAEVSLNAYGQTGPWAARRGYDSLVQMSSGIAHEGMIHAGSDRPTPLPVQALDHATGNLMAAAALRLLRTGGTAHLSLSRTAELVKAHPQDDIGTLSLDRSDEDFAAAAEETPFGPARRLKPAIALTGTPIFWERPATALGSAPASWPAP